MKRSVKGAILMILLVAVVCVSCSSKGIDDIELNSKAVYLLNLDNGQVIYSKNSEKKMEPASLTKIMTTLLVLENCEDIENERITVPSDSLFDEIKKDGGSNIALTAGETLTVKDLLYATMLPSACDAAQVLAYHFGGNNVENFIDMMNRRAQEIGAKDTTFKNSYGLHEDGHITTAYDMSLITLEALKNDTFRKIVSTFTYSIPATEKSEQREIKHTVELMNSQSSNYYRYASGIKTGFTDQAGRCLITMATKDGASYLLVLLGANLDGEPTPIKTFGDAISLFDYAFGAYTMVPAAKAGDVIAESQLYISEDNVKPIRILAKNDINLLLPNGVTADMAKSEFEYSKNLSLPITEGDPLGYVTFSYDGEKIASFEIMSGDSIYDAMPEGGISFYPAKGFNRVTVYKILLVAVVVICIILIFKVLKAKRKRKARRLPPQRRRSIDK